MENFDYKAETKKLAKQGYTRDDVWKVLDDWREQLGDEIKLLENMHIISYLSDILPLGPTQTKGYIYVIKFLQYYKIGRSVKVTDRVAFLSRHLPLKPKLIFKLKVNDMFKAETYLHQKFKIKKTQNEWFKLADEDICYIKSLDYNFYA